MSELQQVDFMGPKIPPHILVMEDEPSLAKGLVMVLKEEGYAVDLAMTGESALSKIGSDSFDLLVADLRLPDMDGMNVIRELKNRMPETMTIIITGYPTVQTAVDSAKIDVFEYLRKPFTEDQFKEAVGRALKKKQEAGMDDFISHTEKGRQILKEEVMHVLDKISHDDDFLQRLMENGSDALKDYRLSAMAREAIITGDLRWIEENVGRLNEQQMELLCSRLERESW
jgi:DNA-binding NtrC family response regulator